jgi:peptide/nickel transport system ATP-binding protein
VIPVTTPATGAVTRSAPVLSVEGLTVDFATDRGWVNIVDGVDLALTRGTALGLVGESGSGKSVTSLAIMGLLPAGAGRVRDGSIRLGDVELTSRTERQLQDVRGNEIAMIFQEPATSLNPAFRVGEQIAEMVRRHRGASRKQARARAIEVLGEVGIPNPARRVDAYPHEFSGGMRQRVMIAMAISCEPRVLIADEPTTALDVTIQAQVLALLDRLRREHHMALLLITHDLGVVAQVCDEATVMYSGQIVERGPVRELFRRPLHPYAEGLLVSMPQLAPRSHGRLASIPGAPPIPWRLPTGCRFHPRCPYAVDACRETAPELAPAGEARAVRCLRSDELRLHGGTSS